MQQVPPYLQHFQERDPEFCQMVMALQQKIRAPGALDAKTKALITLALDTAGGHPDGVKSLAGRARSLGASEAEIVETLRLAFMVSGVPGLVTSRAAFET
ncbi:MAG: carboxymuconolactone decarboxylase family protein [Chloroflexi bacterium]|nr:carboxymuconolactone decarboxylase family protein [Chloroflexota bacterium]